MTGLSQNDLPIWFKAIHVRGSGTHFAVCSPGSLQRAQVFPVVATQQGRCFTVVTVNSEVDSEVTLHLFQSGSNTVRRI
jgi:hypothetical protein